MEASGGKRFGRAAIAVLIGVVFIGWMLQWAMIPTNAHLHIWQPNVAARTNSKYFGAQGANLLTSTFPILFISVLGCIFLHLGKSEEPSQEKISDHMRKPKPLAEWRRPILVKGPLGIVSGLELAFLAMFVALLLWALASFLYTGFAKINAQSVHQLGEKLWQVRVNSAGLWLGRVGAISFAFLFFPVTRGSSLLRIVGLTSEGSVKYHMWLGHIAMIFFTAHSLCYVVFWASKNQMYYQFLRWDKIGVAKITGKLGFVCGLLMWGTSMRRLRRSKFEVFYYTHHLYLLFVPLFVLHVGISYIGLVLPAFYLFLIDRYLRFLHSQRRVRLISSRLLISCQALELNFSKSPELSYSPTSVLFVNVPSISRLQWHPFTVVSNSSLEKNRVSVVIKGEGSWSRKLYDQMLSSSSDPLQQLDVSVEGPYGPASTNFLRYERLVLVSGGSGITPFISIIRELIFLSSTDPNLKTPKIQLVCMFRNSEQLTMIDLLLPDQNCTDSGHDMINIMSGRLQLQIDAYLTREEGPNNNIPNTNTSTSTGGGAANSDHIDHDDHETTQLLMKTLWFKPKASALPVSPILGPNSWLCLAAIISTSFLIFLLLLAILSRFLIHPIEDANRHFFISSFLRSLVNIFLICVSIAVPSTSVVLWNNKMMMRAKQPIENNEEDIIISPTSTSHASSSNNVINRELESGLPHHQSLIRQIVQVHFKARPDLKKILLECEESSVGVLASGPKGMRHDVAAICSSGLADNLHFESISFSW
ncbi:hypothetical protein H6P81_008380 [Aristolochia fimbriata]|uniref:FAD-binding FR-type domain-containing protein n=1 Tax=Aristolochia fimbriata TaxID=158543 RepID=A0AAV7F6K9_ARIFI|nr:hypothetical protein H6P81_008380 [Aristolochia fimbriata]